MKLKNKSGITKLTDQNKRNKEEKKIKEAFSMLDEEKDMHEVFKILIKKNHT